MASVDRGISATVVGQMQVRGASTHLGTPASLFSSSENGNLRTSTLSSQETLPATTQGSSGTTVYYKLVGYYALGLAFESFVTTNPTDTSNPNTGHTLTNTYVSATWT